MRKVTFAAVVVFFGLVAVTMRTMNRQPNRGIAYVTLSDIDPQAADRIELTGSQPNLLEKKNDAWYLANGRLADAMQVKNLLKSAEHIQSSDILTRDAARYTEYEVDEAHGTGLRILGGGHELANLTVGRAMSGGLAIRKGDSAYKATGVFPNAFVHNANEWTERRLFLGIASEDVERVEVALRDEAPYALEHKDTEWALAAHPEGKDVSNFRTDAQAAQRLVTDLVQTRADVLLDADPGLAITSMNKAVDRLTIQLKPKNPSDAPVRKTLILGATGDNKSSYVQVEGTPDIAIIPGYTGVTLRKTRENLRDLRLTKPVDLAHIKGLSLRRGKQRLALVRKDGAWSLPAGAAVASGTHLDSVRVQRRAMDVANARGAAVAPGVRAQQAGIASAEGEARLIFEDKSTVAIVFGRRTAGNQVYVQGTADGRVYLVNAALRDHILGMLDTLTTKPEGDPLARFDQDGIGNLPPDVRAGLSEHFAQKKREQQAEQLMKGRGR